jgi:hypothetical protein
MRAAGSVLIGYYLLTDSPLSIYNYSLWRRMYTVHCTVYNIIFQAVCYKFPEPGHWGCTVCILHGRLLENTKRFSPLSGHLYIFIIIRHVLPKCVRQTNQACDLYNGNVCQVDYRKVMYYY